VISAPAGAVGVSASALLPDTIGSTPTSEVILNTNGISDEEKKFLQGLEREIYTERWAADRPNFFGWVYDFDEPPHPNLFLSMKYRMPLSEGSLLGMQRPSFNLGYTGDYDFYADRRPSSPVISRLQNPGLFFRGFTSGEYEKNGFEPYELGFGWWHESNGQTLGSYAAMENFAKYSPDGSHAQDYASMGWDYLALQSNWRWDPQIFGKSFSRLRLNSELRIYTGQQGFYGAPEMNINTSPEVVTSFINYYDGMRLNGLWEWGDENNRLFKYFEIGAELRAGDSPEVLFDHTRPFYGSFIGSLTFRIWILPLTLYYFDGYGPYLSDYYQHTRALGAGVRLW